MEIKVISAVPAVRAWLDGSRSTPGRTQQLWESLVVEPYWNDLTKWAPFDQSFKKPKMITDTAALNQQLDLLDTYSINDLAETFNDIAEMLPIHDDDPILVVIFPLDNSDTVAREKQNGVIGTTIFGNIMLQINPLAPDWKAWIPFVFAHEYHHNVWGNHWYAIRGGQGITGSLLEMLITEGQADIFAQSLYPELIPQWNRPLPPEVASRLADQLSRDLESTDQGVHAKWLFGNEETGIPWCSGYAIGSELITAYLARNPDITTQTLIETPATTIYATSVKPAGCDSDSQVGESHNRSRRPLSPRLE